MKIESLLRFKNDAQQEVAFHAFSSLKLAVSEKDSTKWKVIVARLNFENLANQQLYKLV